MLAPPSRSAIIRLAVSVVTCRHAATRMPARGWVLMNCLRIVARTGIDCAAHSMRRLPASASERSFTSQGTVVVAVLIFILRLKLFTGYGCGHARFLQRGCFVGCFPGK